MEEWFLYETSREVCNDFLTYLVDKGWIKKPEGLYDEMPRLQAILDKALKAKDLELANYLEYHTAMSCRPKEK